MSTSLFVHKKLTDIDDSDLHKLVEEMVRMKEMKINKHMQLLHFLQDFFFLGPDGKFNPIGKKNIMAEEILSLKIEKIISPSIQQMLKDLDWLNQQAGEESHIENLNGFLYSVLTRLMRKMERRMRPKKAKTNKRS